MPYSFDVVGIKIIINYNQLAVPRPPLPSSEGSRGPAGPPRALGPSSLEA
jgi:hypothetical protein